MTVPGRTLFLGGARSGKSTAAEALLRELPVTYVATAADDPADAEWQARVALHRSRRPAHWHTVSTTDLEPVVAAAQPEHPVLVDCLTVWLSRVMDDAGAWGPPTPDLSAVDARIDGLTAALSAADGVVLVSNEVGSGIVPATSSGRLFRDALGVLNMKVAAVCDTVNLVVAGCIVPVKVARP